MDQIQEAVVQLYNAARSNPIDSFLNTALDITTKLVDVDSAYLTNGIASGVGTLGTKGLDRAKRPDFRSEYEEVKMFDTRFEYLRNAEDGVAAFHISHFFSDPADHLMLEFLRRYDHAHTLLGAKFDRDGAIIAHIALNRRDDGRRFKQRDLVVVRNIFPHLVEAIEVNKSLYLRQLQLAAGSEFAFAQTDDRGRIFSSTDDFRDLLRKEWRDFRGQSLPAQLLIHLLSNERRYIGRDIFVTCKVRHRQLLVKARARAKTDVLSPREIEIARLISAGKTHKEIAKALSLAPVTVRNHTQAIYAKLAVGNKVSLTRLMLANK